MHHHEDDKVVSGLISEKDMCKIREAVCIQTEKIYDSCKEKDCIENARVIFKDLSPVERDIINNAFNVKIRKAVVKDVVTDIEPVPFKRGFYTIDVKYVIKVTLDFFTKVNDVTDVHTLRGYISFDKKVILFGSEGNVKIFKSHFEEDEMDKPVKSKLQQDNLPISKVEVAEPIPLNARIRNIGRDNDEDRSIANDSRCDSQRPDPTKRVFVTVGIFSIIKLARIVQLLIPAFDFCYPDKECVASTDDDPCELFETIDFPFDEFFPPQKFDFPGALEQEANMIQEAEEHHKHKHGCGCHDD